MKYLKKIPALFPVLLCAGALWSADIPLADSKVDTLFFKTWNSSNGMISDGPPHSYPRTFCVDGDGAVWIPDGINSNLMKKFSPEGNLLQVVTNRGAGSVLDCGTDQSNNLYVLSGDTTVRYGCHVQKFGNSGLVWTYKDLIFTAPVFTLTQSGFQFLFERLDDGNGIVKVLDRSGKVAGILPPGFYAWPSQRRFVTFRPTPKPIENKRMILNSYTNIVLLPEEKSVQKKRWRILQRSVIKMSILEKYYSPKFHKPALSINIPEITDTMISPLGMDSYGSFFGLFRTPLTDRYFVLRINSDGAAVRIPVEPFSMIANRPVCIDRYGQVYEIVFEELGMKVVRWSPVK